MRRYALAEPSPSQYSALHIAKGAPLFITTTNISNQDVLSPTSSPLLGSMRKTARLLMTVAITLPLSRPPPKLP